MRRGAEKISVRQETVVSDDAQPKTDVEGGPSSFSESFQRIQERVEGELLSIEESIKKFQTSLDRRTQEAVQDIDRRLQGAGLGVLATRSSKIVREELGKYLKAEDLISPLVDAVSRCRVDLSDAIAKTARGAARAAYPFDLRLKLVQMYTTRAELSRKLELAAASIQKLRARTAELEGKLSLKEMETERLRSEVSSLQEQLGQLKSQLSERDSTVNELKSELSRASAVIDELRATISQLSSADALLSEHKIMTEELAQLKGTNAALEESLTQRDTTIEYLRAETGRLEEESDGLQKRLLELDRELRLVREEQARTLDEITALRAQNTELSARWDLLFRVAEDEPAFRAYFLIAGKSSWFPMSHISSALGIPTARLRLQLQKFIDAGLLEVEGDRIRARNISETAREIAGAEEQLVAEIKSDLEKSGTPLIRAIDYDEFPLEGGGEDENPTDATGGDSTEATPR
ncbi:MAG: hypothetical protein QXQ81_01405 [Candidatus Thorarchaeota archaeon]